MRLARINQPHRGERMRSVSAFGAPIPSAPIPSAPILGAPILGAPSAPLNHQAGRADVDIERIADIRIRRNRADPVLGLHPRHVGQQPRPRRVGCELDVRGFRHRVKIDQPVLMGKRHAIGRMAAFDRAHLHRFGDAQPLPVGLGGFAPRTGDEMIRVGAPKRGDLRANIRDVQYGRQHFRAPDERTGALAPLDQVVVCQFSERLADRHARAAVLDHQIQLDGKPVSRRPFARQNAASNIGADALVQRLRNRHWSESCGHDAVLSSPRGQSGSPSGMRPGQQASLAIMSIH